MDVAEETVKLHKNPHMEDMKEDVLYHIGLSTGAQDLKAMFGDVKFVCMGGTPHRMESFARTIMKEIGYQLPTGSCLMDISKHSHRYSTSCSSLCSHVLISVFQVCHVQGWTCIECIAWNGCTFTFDSFARIDQADVACRCPRSCLFPDRYLWRSRTCPWHHCHHQGSC